MTRPLSGAATLLAALLVGGPALAAAPNNCTISAVGVAFGLYDRLSRADLTSTGSITITCTKPGPVTIALTSGANNSFINRAMRAAGNSLLFYNLYLDAAATRIWGDGTGGSQVFTATNPGAATTIPVFGRIPTAQGQARAGTYADQITVTVTF